MDKDLVVKELQSIVDEFNKFFDGWEKRHGCVANFGWQYSPYAGIGQRPSKTMTISNIDLIVAPTRFDELMRLIRRTKTEEETFDL